MTKTKKKPPQKRKPKVGKSCPECKGQGVLAYDMSHWLFGQETIYRSCKTCKGRKVV